MLLNLLDTQGMYFWAHHCFDVLSGGLLGVAVTLSVLLGCSSFGGVLFGEWENGSETVDG